MKRDFVELLRECNAGAFSVDCTERLEELVKAVEEHGKGGSLTIELKVMPNGDGTASVVSTVKIKKPTKRRAPSVFFIHRDGLHREHPNQMRMFEGGSKVRSIDEVRKEVKEI